jgi:CheY-like chemotaxis protein
VIEIQNLSGLKLLILLVEDQFPNVLIATTLLEEFGCEFDVASNGAEAFALFQAKKYSAVLMDIQMPLVDGFEATRLIRQFEFDHQVDYTPIIALTANCTQTDIARCVTSGMNEFLSKPYLPEQLWDKINSQVKNRH